MKSPDHLKPNGFALNLTPMIDVVFLLIIFFIVSSNLVQQDVTMEVDLPAAETAKQSEGVESRKMTINVPKPGSVLLGSQSMDPAALKDAFLRQRQAWGDETEIRIRTDKSVPYGEIEPILVLAAQCGIWDVSFAVVEKRP